MTNWAEKWKDQKQKDCWFNYKRTEDDLIKSPCSQSLIELMEAHYSYVDYPGPLLSHIQSYANPNMSVLDIGAGDGAFTIPLARIVKKVTAVDPSLAQISWMLDKAEQANLININIINNRWEEINENELDQHDIVIASHCFSMPDMNLALQKMLNKTKEYLFLITSVDSGMTNIYQGIYPDYRTSIGEYIHLYNLLYQIGIYSNIAIIKREFLHPLSLLMDLLSFSYNISAEIKEKIREELSISGQLLKKDGSFWINTWHKDAIIWYKMERE